jgi:hypothetical protein
MGSGAHVTHGIAMDGTDGKYFLYLVAKFQFLFVRSFRNDIIPLVATAV